MKPPARAVRGGQPPVESKHCEAPPVLEASVWRLAASPLRFRVRRKQEKATRSPTQASSRGWVAEVLLLALLDLPGSCASSDHKQVS